jgi:hypothetical protein
MAVRKGLHGIVRNPYAVATVNILHCTGFFMPLEATQLPARTWLLAYFADYRQMRTYG